MRKLFTFGCLWAVGSMLWAQPDDAKYRELMKQIGPATGALNKKIAAKDGTAAEDAKKLHALFGDVQSFWKARNAADATTFAGDAAAGFGSVGELAMSGKWDDAAASLKKTTANCGGCHTAHREKAADGSWKIK
jgi:cytochrome c556